MGRRRGPASRGPAGGRGGSPAGNRLLPSNTRGKPGVQVSPAGEPTLLMTPTATEAGRRPGLRVHPEPNFRLRRQVWLRPQLPGDAGVSAAARDRGPTPRHQRQLSSQVPSRPRLQGRGLLAGGGGVVGAGLQLSGPGPASPPPNRPTARGREPFLRIRVPGRGPGWVTHLDHGPSGGRLSSLPAPPRATH